ncbi:arrestin domain-containing protein 3-like [Sebastes umbrosus]|uniref:arrestin domain-containing protein 3-like n=1 Tax=Sebastes umbrosus TaxID=72105 RepID=UPI0018A1012D|nr:arrestin domain-containing protein 3-like [Sebastes umbrosus]
MFKQPIKNFSINFNALNERNTIYSGALLTGHISFDLTTKTKITSITMALGGKANVHWSRGGGGKKRRRTTVSAKLVYFNLESAILQENTAIGENAKLQPGTHVYPFTCQLPHGDFPSSFNGPNGKILYTLTVGINRPWHMSKDFVTELNYSNRIQTDQPELQAPLAGSNIMTLCCLWCGSGPITLSASIEKKAFTPGEIVKIVCKFSNGSSRKATPKASLHHKQVYYTHNRVSKHMITRNVVSTVGIPVSPNTSDVHAEILLPIPPTASLTISNCALIEADYIIEMSLGVRFSPDLTVLFPIILCDTSVAELYSSHDPCL